MCRQLVPGLVVRLTVIKAKTRPGIEAIARIALDITVARIKLSVVTTVVDPHQRRYDTRASIKLQ